MPGVASASTAGARAQLGLGSLLALGLNGVIGVGIFFAPAEVAGALPGPAGVLAYLLTALALLPIAWVYALLGGRILEDGGPYLWAREAFGAGLAFMVGWLSYVSALFSTAAVLGGLSQHLGPELGLTGGPALALVLLGLLAAVVALGLRPSAAVWTGFTLLKLLPLLLVLGFGVALLLGGEATWATRPAAKEGNFLEALSRAMLVVLFAMQGFEVVPVLAGRARGGGRTVALATLGTLLLVTVLYAWLHLTCVVSTPRLAAEGAPLVAAAGHLGGSLLERVVALGTNLSALGVAFGMVAVTPMYLAVLHREGRLFAWLAPTDAGARAALGVTVVLLTATLSFDVGNLFALSSVAVLAQYGVAALSLAVMAWRGQRGFRTVHLLPVPPALVTGGLLALAAKPLELATAAAFLLFGLFLLALARAARRGN